MKVTAINSKLAGFRFRFDKLVMSCTKTFIDSRPTEYFIFPNGRKTQISNNNLMPSLTIDYVSYIEEEGASESHGDQQ